MRQHLQGLGQKKMNKEKRALIFKQFEHQNPHPTTELIYHSPFELLVAVMLSAQATDISVNKATALLFKEAPTPKAMLDLGEAHVLMRLKSLNYYKTKTANVLKTCQVLLDHHNGEVPNEREALEALPGVGRKTANVLLNTLFGLPTIAVDTHIFRVANRIGLAKGKTPLEVEKILLKTIPKIYLKNAHHWLILQGRYICKAQKPLCQSCPIRDLCEFPDKNYF